MPDWCHCAPNTFFNSRNTSVIFMFIWDHNLLLDRITIKPMTEIKKNRVMCLFINQELESSIFLGFTSFVNFSTDIESSWNVELGKN